MVVAKKSDKFKTRIPVRPRKRPLFWKPLRRILGKSIIAVKISTRVSTFQRRRSASPGRKAIWANRKIAKIHS